MILPDLLYKYRPNISLVGKPLFNGIYVSKKKENQIINFLRSQQLKYHQTFKFKH